MINLDIKKDTMKDRGKMLHESTKPKPLDGTSIDGKAVDSPKKIDYNDL